MDQLQHNLIKNQRGEISLIGVLIALPLISLLALAVFSLLTHLQTTSATTRDFEELNGVIHEVRALLQEPSACQFNLGMHRLNMTNLKGEEVNLIQYKREIEDVAFAQNTDARRDLNILKPNMVVTDSRVTANAIWLRPESQLLADRYMAYLEVQLSKGSFAFVRRIPLIARINTTSNLVVECSTISQGNSFTFDELNRVCYLASNGDKVYDLNTKSCRYTVEPAWYNQSDPDKAFCPAGFKRWNSVVSQSCRSNGIQCQVTGLSRRYRDRRLRSGNPPCTNNSLAQSSSGQQGCDCVYINQQTVNGMTATLVAPGICEVSCIGIPPEVF